MRGRATIKGTLIAAKPDEEQIKKEHMWRKANLSVPLRRLCHCHEVVDQELRKSWCLPKSAFLLLPRLLSWYRGLLSGTGSTQTLANQVILLMILSFMTFQTSESKLRGRSHITSAAGGGVSQMLTIADKGGCGSEKFSTKGFYVK